MLAVCDNGNSGRLSPGYTMNKAFIALEWHFIYDMGYCPKYPTFSHNEYNIYDGKHCTEPGLVPPFGSTMVADASM